MNSPTYTSFMPIRAWANIEPSSSITIPTSGGMTRERKSRLARSTRANASNDPAMTPGSRQENASRPVSIRSAAPEPCTMRVSPLTSTPRRVPALEIAANGESPWTSTTTTLPSASRAAPTGDICGVPSRRIVASTAWWLSRT